MKKLAVLCSLFVIGSAHAGKWNASNNPTYFNGVMDSPMRMDLQSLPMSAKLRDARLGWSETYWPANLGGVAYRWSSPNPEPFKYKLKSKSELIRMSEEELSELSPAELYDISQGDYGYTLTKKVLRANSPSDLWWEGICHGWSLAASHYPEPDQVVVTNKDGIRVPFGSSDVKGLMALHDAWNSKGLYVRVGDRCGQNGKVEGEAFPEDGYVAPISAKAASRPECEDVNAGAFHLVITNMIGINSQGFIADIDRYNDVWNQPITGYDAQVMGEETVNNNDLRNGVVRKVRIKNVMTYGDELEFYSKKLEAEGTIGWVSKLPVTSTPMQTFGTRNYEYILELNSRNEIIGGTWISESRPDMMWMKRKDDKFMNGKYPLAGLNQIYRPISK